MDGDSLWQPAPKYIGTCCKCGRSGLKRNMTALYVKENSYSPMRILCHLCPRCLPEALEYLGASMP